MPVGLSSTSCTLSQIGQKHFVRLEIFATQNCYSYIYQTVPISEGLIQPQEHNDEYAYHIPNPYATLVHQGKVLSTQDKHYVSWAALQSYAAAATAL